MKDGPNVQIVFIAKGFHCKISSLGVSHFVLAENRPLPGEGWIQLTLPKSVFCRKVIVTRGISPRFYLYSMWARDDKKEMEGIPAPFDSDTPLPFPVASTGSAGMPLGEGRQSAPDASQLASSAEAQETDDG